VIKLVIPFPDSILRPNDKSHWAKKNPAKNAYKIKCQRAAERCQKPVIHSDKLVFDLHFTPPNARWDWDAMISAAKSGFDAVAGVWQIDDRYFRPSKLYWNKPDKHNPHIMIVVPDQQAANAFSKTNAETQPES
jgi:hypothetical protein